MVSEMLGVPTPGFKWVYPPRTRCWRLLCRGVSAGFFSAFCCSTLEQRELALLAWSAVPPGTRQCTSPVTTELRPWVLASLLRLALCLAVIAASSVCSWTGCGVKKLQTLFVCTLDTARPDYLCYDLHGVASRIVLLWAPRNLAACLRRSSIGWLGPGVSTATLYNDFGAPGF